jgi:hypothetical protein
VITNTIHKADSGFASNDSAFIIHLREFDISIIPCKHNFR